MLNYQKEGSWGRVVLSAPETRNMLSIRFLKSLKSLLVRIAADQLEILSIESSSDHIFAAGADMNELLDLDPQKALLYAGLGQSVMDLIEHFNAPVFALVSGPCMGGGFDLALACGTVWVAENAVFCNPGAALGLITGFGGTVRLTRRIPPPMARHMLLTGYRLGAREALSLGLASRLFPSRSAMLAGLGDQHGSGSALP